MQHSEGKPALIAIDQDRPRSGIEIDASESAPWLIGGGVLSAPSQCQDSNLQMHLPSALDVGFVAMWNMIAVNLRTST